MNKGIAIVLMRTDPEQRYCVVRFDTSGVGTSIKRFALLFYTKEDAKPFAQAMAATYGLAVLNPYE